MQVFYQFKNEAKAGLGMPMPAGVVRVYQADSKGGTQFVGEDRIDHTPKDETLNLKIGNAFDVVAERKQIDFEKIASNVYEMEYEVVAAQPQDDAGDASKSTSRSAARGACSARRTSGRRPTPGPRSSTCRSLPTERQPCAIASE